MKRHEPALLHLATFLLIHIVLLHALPQVGDGGLDGVRCDVALKFLIDAAGVGVEDVAVVLFGCRQHRLELPFHPTDSKPHVLLNTVWQFVKNHHLGREGLQIARAECGV